MEADFKTTLESSVKAIPFTQMTTEGDEHTLIRKTRFQFPHTLLRKMREPVEFSCCFHSENGIGEE
jgi:hypothetical protein